MVNFIGFRSFMFHKVV